MKFLKSVTVPKNEKGGTLWVLMTSIVLQNIETNECGLFGAIQTFQKKSMPKKSKLKTPR